MQRHLLVGGFDFYVYKLVVVAVGMVTALSVLFGLERMRLGAMVRAAVENQGLAPVIVDALLEAFTRLRAETAMSVVIVEQSARLAAELADHAVLIERGRVRTQDERADLLARWDEVETLLSVA